MLTRKRPGRRMANKKDTVSGVSTQTKRNPACKKVSFERHRIWTFICQPQCPYGNPPDFFPLWFAAREDNTLSSRLTRPSHFPSVSFYYFTYRAIWPGNYQDCQIKKTPFQVSLFIWQLPILPGRFQPSTFGVCELNFRVRHGNGCILTAIATISEGCSFKTI